MSIKDRLIQFVLRGKDELSPEAKKSAEALAAVSAEAEELGKVLDSAKDARGLARGLEATQRAAEQAERGLVQADLQIKELRDALNKSPGSAGLEQSLKDAEREARRMQRGLDALRVSLADQEKAAQAAGIDTNNLADEEKRLAAEVDKAKVALAANSQQLKALQRDQAAASRSAAEHTSRIDAARSAMAGGAKQVLAFAAAYISLNAAFGLVQRGIGLVRDGIGSMLQTGDQFELLGKRLTSLMGSVAGGEQATAWIKQFAKDTPLEVADVAEAFALLKTYGLDPMDGSLQAIVDKNEQLGGGMERLQGIASALGQAYAKQKLQTEEILQLVERGVPVWGMLEKITGKNAAQLSKLATEGRLGRDVIKALVAEIGKSAEGAAADGMNTLTGKVSNLKDVWADFQDRVAESGALDFAKKKLGELAAKIDEMDKDGRLDKLAESLSEAFIQGAEKAEELAKKLLDVDFDKLTEDSTRWLNEFGSKLDNAGRAVTLVTAPVRVLTNVVTGGIAAIGVASGALFGSSFKALATLARLIPDAFGGDAVVAGLERASETAFGLMRTMAAQVAHDGRDITSTWDSVAAAAEGSAARQSAAARRAAEETRQAMQQNGEDIASFFRQNIATVEQALAAIAFAETAQDLAEIETALSLTVLASDELAVAMAALAQKRGFVDVGQAIASTAETAQIALTDMASALQLIDTASSVQQLEGLRGALLKAFQDGRITQEQYAQATGLLNGKLGELGGAADDTGSALSGLGDEFGDMASIMRGVGSAMNEVDFNRLRTGIRKAYSEGKISADEFAKAQAELNKRIKDLKPSADKGTEALGEQRKAIDANMQSARRGISDVGDAAEEASGGLDFFGAVMTAARTPLANMSKAALEAFDALRGIKNTDVELDTSGADKTGEALARVREEAKGLQAEMGLLGSRDYGFGTWMRETALRSREVQAEYLAQKLRLQELTEGYSSGAMSAAAFARAARSAKGDLKLLDESDLSGLESSIQSAEQQMKQLGDSSRSTLESLQDELDKLEGREADAERRRFAARQRELEVQLDAAQAAGDRNAVANAQRSISVLRQIETATAQKRQQDEQQKRLTAAAPAPAAAASGPQKVIRLETTRGKAVEVAVNSAADETNLLGILEEAGMRTL